MALLIFLAALVVLSLASLAGWIPDSRDTRYSLGHVLDWRPVPKHRGG
jgi:hypothetical protein